MQTPIYTYYNKSGALINTKRNELKTQQEVINLKLEIDNLNKKILKLESEKEQWQQQQSLIK